MTRQEAQRTREYRDHLIRSLAVAKLRLRSNEFEAFAPAITQQIEAADEELGRHQLEAFLGCAHESHSAGWNCVSIVRDVCMTVRRAPAIQYNSPAPASAYGRTTRLEFESKGTDTALPYCLA